MHNYTKILKNFQKRQIKQMIEDTIKDSQI